MVALIWEGNKISRDIANSHHPAKSLADFKVQVNRENLKATFFILRDMMIVSEPTLAAALSR